MRDLTQLGQSILLTLSQKLNRIIMRDYNYIINNLQILLNFILRRRNAWKRENLSLMLDPKFSLISGENNSCE